MKPRDSLLGANVSVAFGLSVVQHSRSFFLKNKGGGGEATLVLSRAQNINEEGVQMLRKASAARVNRRLRRHYLIVRLLPNVFVLACLPLGSI